MGSDYFWVNQRTWDISSLPKFIGFNVAASLSSAVIAFNLRDASPDTSCQVFFYASIATMAMAVVGSIRMLATCDYIYLSKEEQRLLKQQNQEDKIRTRRQCSTTVELVKNLLCEYIKYKTSGRDDSLKEGNEINGLVPVSVSGYSGAVSKNNKAIIV